MRRADFLEIKIIYLFMFAWKDKQFKIMDAVYLRFISQEFLLALALNYGFEC